MDKVSHKDLWERTNRVQIEITILKRGWGWLGPHREKVKQQNYDTDVDVVPPGQEKEGAR